MALSYSSLSATFLPIGNSTSISGKPNLSVHSLPLNGPKLQTPLLRPLVSKVSAAPEVLDSATASFEDEAPALETPSGADSDMDEAPALETSSGADSDMVAPKHKIRIKLRSYWVPLIEDSCKQIMDAAKNTNAKTMGPVPLPTKKRVYCVLKSPHVHKDARFHFEIRIHRRLIDILYPTAQTIDSLMQLDLPAGVDVEVKL